MMAAAVTVASCGASPRSAGPATSRPATTATTTGSAPAPPSSTTTTSKPAATLAPTTTTKPVPTSATISTAPARDAACATSHLRLSSGGAFGAAGTEILTYYLTDVGGTACTMIGYPGVAVLNARGGIVQHAADHRSGPGTTTAIPVRLLTLNPGQRATFLVASTNTIPVPGCATAYTGTTFQVFPPNQSQPIEQPYHGRFCDLAVGPVH